MDHSAHGSAEQLLEIEQDITAAEACIVLRGELDIASATQLRTALRAAIESAAPTVRIDTAGLRFIDAAGIGELVQAHNALRGTGRTLTLDNVSSRVFRTFLLAEVVWLLD